MSVALQDTETMTELCHLPHNLGKMCSAIMLCLLNWKSLSVCNGLFVAMNCEQRPVTAERSWICAELQWKEWWPWEMTGWTRLAKTSGGIESSLGLAKAPSAGCCAGTSDSDRNLGELGKSSGLIEHPLQRGNDRKCHFIVSVLCYALRHHTGSVFQTLK